MITRPRLEALEDRCLLSFSPAVNYPTSSAETVVVADFNVDGILDQVAGGASFLGNGDGTFRQASWGGGEVVADFNLDGWPDVASRSGSLFLGNGDGTFQQGSLGAFGQSIAVGDLNNDGKPDAVMGWPGDSEYGLYTSLIILIGNGDGTFAQAYYQYLPNIYGELHSVALADLDADGLLDVVAGVENPGASDYQVIVVPGAGGLDILPGYGSRYAGFTNTLAVGDVNGDSHPDIVSTIETTDEVLVNLGTGNGTFAGPVAYAAGASPRSPAVADINRDGLPDLVIANHGRWDGADYVGEGVSVLLGRGNGSFAAPEHYSTSHPAQDVAAGDFNGDGYTDLTAAVGIWNQESGTWENAAGVLINDGIWTPPPPSITITDVTFTEGHTGTRGATFTVTLSAASSQTVTVSYATADGTAAAGSDYAAASGTLTFAPGETSKTVTVLVNGDRLGEANETFLVNLGGATNATIADSQAVGTVVDDEPRISIGDVTRYEGKKGQKTLFTFTVTLSAAYDQAVTMSFRTVNGTATTGDGDYVARTGTLTFAPGETTKTITIEVIGDGKREANESFYLDLFDNSRNSLFTRNRGLGTIRNDD